MAASAAAGSTPCCALYDFPDPTMTAPQRELTTSPLQQLFVMNSPFMKDRADDAGGSGRQGTDDTAKIRDMYRQVLDRDPSPKELDLARSSYIGRRREACGIRAGIAGNQRGNFLAMKTISHAATWIQSA